MLFLLLFISLGLFVDTQQPFVWIPHTSELTSVELRLTINCTWWVYQIYSTGAGLIQLTYNTLWKDLDARTVLRELLLSDLSFSPTWSSWRCYCLTDSRCHPGLHQSDSHETGHIRLPHGESKCTPFTFCYRCICFINWSNRDGQYSQTSFGSLAKDRPFFVQLESKGRIKWVRETRVKTPLSWSLNLLNFFSWESMVFLLV